MTWNSAPFLNRFCVLYWNSSRQRNRLLRQYFVHSLSKKPAYRIVETENCNLFKIVYFTTFKSFKSKRKWNSVSIQISKKEIFFRNNWVPQYIKLKPPMWLWQDNIFLNCSLPVLISSKMANTKSLLLGLGWKWPLVSFRRGAFSIMRSTVKLPTVSTLIEANTEIVIIR